MGEPPLLAGADQLTVAVALPAEAVTLVGTPGMVGAELPTTNDRGSEAPHGVVTCTTCRPSVRLGSWAVTWLGPSIVKETGTPSTETAAAAPSPEPVTVSGAPPVADDGAVEKSRGRRSATTKLEPVA